MENNQHPDTAGEIERLKNYIQQELYGGLQPNEISAHLHQAGWPEDLITQAFQHVQAQVVPSSPPQPQPNNQIAAAVYPEAISAPGIPQAMDDTPQRGRTKSGWLLLKQSLKILKENKALTRYVFISALISFGLFIIFAIIFALGKDTLVNETINYSGQTDYGLKPVGYLVVFTYYILAYFIINLYSTGMVMNVLDIFKGVSRPYGEYMGLARSKASTIFALSLIEATVGLVLRMIAERSQLLGRIIVWLIGAVWSIARLFAIPVIATGEKNAFKAIKKSTLLVKATWGENIVSRASFGIAYFLIFLAIFFLSIFIIVIGGSVGGSAGVVWSIGFVWIIWIVVSIIASAASTVLNTALFYYAEYKQIPPAYNAELLNSAFVKRKRRGLFRRTA